MGEDAVFADDMLAHTVLSGSLMYMAPEMVKGEAYDEKVSMNLQTDFSFP